MAADVDVRDVLLVIGVLTLDLTCLRPRRGRIRHGAHTGAQRIEAPGPDYMVSLLGDRVFDEVERFVPRARGTEPDTVLAPSSSSTSSATAMAAALGDRAWADLVRRHHSLVRSHLDRFRGREMDTAGDGFFAAFDGPIRAIRCATTIGSSVPYLGRKARRAAHGRMRHRRREDQRPRREHRRTSVVAGAPGELLVTSSVKDLVAASVIGFQTEPHELKGVPGEWRLYAAIDAG